MIIPKVSQVPLQQPMYVNGVMHPVWINFFERLAALNNESNIVDLIELLQKLNEMPSLAAQSLLNDKVNGLLNQLNIVQVHNGSNCIQLDPIPIHQTQSIELPPVQAVFLCPQESLMMASLPSSEVISD